MNMPLMPRPGSDNGTTAPSRWHARLSLGVRHTPRGSRVASAERLGPLHLQKPFYPEGPDLAHLYLLHPPGGMVSGDLLEIEARLEPNTAALITTCLLYTSPSPRD